LVVMGLIVQASAAWLFESLKEREHRKYQPLAPLAAKERVFLPDGLGKIPQPRLQESEPLDLANLRKEEDSRLKSYGWVERDKGIVHIPIEEAMRLLAETKTPNAKETKK
jgi:hypothetical protein